MRFADEGCALKLHRCSTSLSIPSAIVRCISFAPEHSPAGNVVPVARSCFYPFTGKNSVIPSGFELQCVRYIFITSKMNKP
jgi:hypothetical protein